MLQNVIQQTTVKLTDKDKAIYELQFIIQELKQAAGIEAEAGRVLLTLADDNSVEFERSQSVLSEAEKITAEGRGMLWPRGVMDAADDATIGLKNANELDQRANRRVEVLVKGVDLNAPSVRRTEPTADSATP